MKLKSLKRLLKTAAITVVTAAMCFGVVSPALAADTATGGQLLENGVTITKNLHMADGITMPDEDFTFKIEKQNGVETTAAVAPSLNDNDNNESTNTVIISYDPQNTGTESNDVYAKTSANLLDGVVWPHAGVYQYKIFEQSGDTQGMTYDESYYILRVYVENTENATDDGTTPTVKYATLEKFDNATDNDGDKVEALVFDNTYVKDGGSDDNVSALEISKTVPSSYGDKTKDFTFSLTLIPASTTVVDENTTVTGKIGTETVTVKYNVPTTFYLQDGEKLVFAQLPAGTHYKVTETGTSGYTGKLDVTENGGEVLSYIADTAGTDVGTDNLTGKTGGVLVGENENTAVFTNTYADITPTGLFIDNLPFILLIVIGACGIGAYMVSRRRRYQG